MKFNVHFLAVVILVVLHTGTAVNVDTNSGFLDVVIGANDDITRRTNINSNSILRIVGGATASKTRFPYFTAIFENNTVDSFFCGGSLIRDNVVITAAHCVVEGFAVPPVVAVNFTEFSYDLSSHIQVRNVTGIHIHPNYTNGDWDTISNDIALLILESSVVGIPPITLNKNSSIPLDNQTLTTIGLGLTQDDGDLSDKLLTVDVPTVNMDQCIKSYLDTLFGLDIIPDLHICAGFDGGGKGSCQGDSGGPVIVLGKTPEEDVLVGLTSFGEGCARDNVPDVSSRVSAFQNWISCVMEGTCTDNPNAEPPPPNDDDDQVIISVDPRTSYVLGPTVTVNITVTTDANPGETRLFFRDMCTGEHWFLGFDQANTQYSKSITLPTIGQYKLGLFDDGTDGLESGGATFESNGEVLHTITPGNAFFSDSVIVAVISDASVRVGQCTPQIVPGPTANVTVTLYTDTIPEEIKDIGYFNLCTMKKKFIFEIGAGNTGMLDRLRTYEFPVALPTGEYEFFLDDISGRGIYPGFWSIDAGNVTLYENRFFYTGSNDKSVQIKVGGGCNDTSPMVPIQNMLVSTSDSPSGDKNNLAQSNSSSSRADTKNLAQSISFVASVFFLLIFLHITPLLVSYRAKN